jgi:endoglucanase
MVKIDPPYSRQPWLLAFTFYFATSALGLVGCAKSPPTPSLLPDTGPAPRGRLRVSQGKILDGEGRQAVLRGLSLGAIWSVKGLGRWNEAYFANARAWGAEMVRVPVFPFTFQFQREETLRDLDDAMTWCERQNLYLIIDYHMIGNATQSLCLCEEHVTWDDFADFWGTVAARYADRPTLAFADIYTEPVALDLANGWDWSDYRLHADAIVALIRQKAPKLIPVLGGMDYCYDLSPGGERPFSDPDVVLAAHPFPGTARASRLAAWENNFGYLSARYAFLLEFGFDPDDSGGYRDDLSYGRQIVGYAAERNMSWTAFVFHKEEGWPMPLFSDWDTLTPTVSGQFFKDVLAGQPLETAGTTASDGVPDGGATSIDGGESAG